MNYLTSIPFRSQRLRLLQGITAATSFSLLLAGTNSLTPLMPVYKNVLHFSPLLMSLTFVSYVLVLIVMLLVLSRPSFVRWSAICLCTALLVAVLSDGILSIASEHSIMLGRAFAGMAGGLGTGSAAALVVVAMGAKGRSVSATGNLIGAVIGTLFAQWCVNLMHEHAMQWVFYIHGAACLVMFCIMGAVLLANRNVNKSHLATKRSAVKTARFPISHYFAPLALGCISWAALGSAIVFLPSFYDSLSMPAASQYAIILMLVLSASGQLGSPWLSGVFPRMSGVSCLVLGTAMIIFSGMWHQNILAITGCGLLGFSVGVIYRLCLVVITHGVSPSEHGARSSFYAAVTYCSSAFIILACGMLGNITGLNNMVTGLYGFIFLCCVLFFTRAPKLQEGNELTELN